MEAAAGGWGQAVRRAALLALVLMGLFCLWPKRLWRRSIACHSCALRDVSSLQLKGGRPTASAIARCYHSRFRGLNLNLGRYPYDVSYPIHPISITYHLIPVQTLCRSVVHRDAMQSARIITSDGTYLFIITHTHITLVPVDPLAGVYLCMDGPGGLVQSLPRPGYISTS